MEKVTGSYLAFVMTVLQPVLLFVHNQSIIYHSNTRRVLRKSPVEGAFVLASRRSGAASREWYHSKKRLIGKQEYAEKWYLGCNIEREGGQIGG